MSAVRWRESNGSLVASVAGAEIHVSASPRRGGARYSVVWESGGSLSGTAKDVRAAQRRALEAARIRAALEGGKP